MNAIRVICNCDENPPLLGVHPSQIFRISQGIAVARIRGGMTSGKSAVAITAALPDGKHVFLEMSISNFLSAAQIFRVQEEQEGN
jgi:hypothetical protein